MALVHSPHTHNNEHPRPLAIILPIFDDDASDGTDPADRPIRGVMVLILDGSRTGNIPDEEDSFQEILNRLMQLHEPKPTPTSSKVLESFPTITSEEALQLGPRCCVCLEDFEADNTEQSIVKLQCNHPFHKECVVSWLKDHNTCPVCRYEFQTEPEAPSAPTESTSSSSSDNNTQIEATQSSQTRDQPIDDATEFLMSLLSAVQASEARQTEREATQARSSLPRSPSPLVRVAMLSPQTSARRPQGPVSRALQWVRRRLSSAFSCFGSRTAD
mmetsp:Transcript_9454/g.13026  ORF Transcript_9454/g.13026 Transcript_9454/m.13026 type:complete len:273 (-) Transcript_9454:165-983(-)